MSETTGKSAPAVEPEPLQRRERVLWNTTAVVIAKALSGAFHLLIVAKMGAHLGKNAMGLYGVLVSSMDVLRIVSNFGLDVVAVRTLAVGGHSPRQLIRHLLALKAGLVAGLCLFVALATSVFGWYAEQRGLLLLLAVGMIAPAATNSLTARFQTEHHMDRLIPVQVAASALYLGGVHLAARRGLGVEAFVGLFVGFELVTLLLTALAARLTWRRPRGTPAPPFERHLAASMLRAGVPVAIMGLIVTLYSRLGLLLIDRFIGRDAAGEYFLALRIAEPLLLVAGALSASVYPVLARMSDEGQYARLQATFLRYSLRPVLVCGALAAALSPLARPLLALIGPEYAAAAPALLALAWATVLMFQNQLSTTVFNAVGKFHYLTGLAGLNLVVFLVLGLVLIPRLGTTGAALSTLGTEAVNCVLQLVQVAVVLRRLRRQTPPGE